MNKDELDETSPVETIEERPKRLCTNEIGARIEAQTPEIKGVGGRENKATGTGNQRLT